jgi:hypothetical protein
MDLQEVEGGGGDWMELGQAVGTCEYSKEPWGSIKMQGISRLASKTG